MPQLRPRAAKWVNGKKKKRKEAKRNWGFISIFHSQANSNISTQIRNNVSKVPSPNSSVTFHNAHIRRSPQCSTNHSRLRTTPLSWWPLTESVCRTTYMYPAHWGIHEACHHTHLAPQKREACVPDGSASRLMSLSLKAPKHVLTFI